MNTDEFGFEYRFSILEKHRDDFVKIGIQFFERRALGMRAAKAWNKTDKQAGIGVALDHRGIRFHENVSGKPQIITLTLAWRKRVYSQKVNDRRIASPPRSFALGP